MSVAISVIMMAEKIEYLSAASDHPNAATHSPNAAAVASSTIG